MYNEMEKPIGIIGAMEVEVSVIVAALADVQKFTWHEFSFYQGWLHDRKVVVVQSGCGKVLAAMTCQRLIDAFGPRAILFSGVAGALGDLDIGDIVLATDTVQHDLDATKLGSPRGSVPFSDYRFFRSDEELLNLASTAEVWGTRILAGRVLTGDQFMSRDELQAHSYLVEEFHGDAIEMEGASVAQVCVVNRLPFLIIRSISDRADSTAKVDFEAFAHKAAKNSLAIVDHVIKNYR